MRGHQYTEEERKFMEEYVPGHSYKEVQAAFTEEFGWRITLSQVKGCVARYHLETGRTGRFEKGHIPDNKGKKGVCAPGCRETWFRKGHIPTNHRLVGSERVNTDGYIEVKVGEPDKWRPKHRVVWEAVNGEIPKGCIVIFKDGDRQNVGIGNLMLVSRGVHAVMNRTGLGQFGGELKETAARIAELKIAAAKKKKNIKG